MINRFTKPAQKVKVFTIVVVNRLSGKVILKKLFTDLIDASRFHDDADMWYGDKHDVKFATATK
jgi:hypothetical protein